MNKIPPQLYLIILCSMLCHVTMSGGRVASGLYVLEAGYGAGVAGLVYSLYSLMPALLALQVGRLVDRIGITGVMHASQVMMLAAVLAPVIWPHPAAVFFTAAASGLGFNSFMVAAFVFVGQSSQGDRSLRTNMFSWVMLGNSVSALLGPTITGMAIDNSGFRSAFAILAVIVTGSLLIGFFFRFRSNTPRLRSAESGVSIWRQLRAEPGMQRVFVVSAALALAWDSFIFLVPVIGHHLNFTATQIGLVMSAFAAGTFAIRLVMPWLSRRTSEWRLLFLALLTNLLVFVLLPLATLHAAMMALAVLFGLSAGGAQPNALSLLHSATPEGQEGEAVGLRATVNHAIGTVNPSLLGGVLAAFGAWPASAFVAVVMAIAARQARRGLREMRKDSNA